jgi:TolB-like protein
MKKLFFIAGLLFLFIGNMQAQERMKIAVMDFNPGVGVSEATVNGLSEMLITALFETRKFTIVERTQINRAIQEQGFQKSVISAGQIAQVGKILGVRYVLIGTVNFIVTERTIENVVTEMAKGEYNIDVRIVDVESGEIISSAGVTQRSTQTTREIMPILAENLVAKIVDANGNVVLLFGYLYVFPEDVGYLNPTGAMEIINNINAVKLYGYNDWRLPTRTELKIILDNRTKLDGIGNGDYLSSSSSHDRGGRIRLVRTNK